MLGLSVKCVGGGDMCRYLRDQGYLPLEIRITNQGTREIGFPLAPLQSQGPLVRLIDNRSGTEYTLPASMPGPPEYTPLQPGQTATLQWVIAGEELRKLGSRPVDATAEISVTVEVRIGDTLVPMTSGTKVRILEEETARP